VATVLRDPEIIAREVAQRREDGSLPRDLAAVERMLATVADKHARIAKRVAAIDDDDVAAPLMAELHALATSKKTAERERDDLRQRVADAEADTTRLRSLSEWCQRVAANLDALTYDERQLATRLDGRAGEAISPLADLAQSRARCFTYSDCVRYRLRWHP
jgi:hypothetical protein